MTNMNDLDEQVILVDLQDRETGVAPKLDAHRAGLLHRAISVCIVDARGRMLLQQRASGKYHSGGLWTNACCTHPRAGEGVREAAERRLEEELGVKCPLHWMLRTHYQAPVSRGLIENEVVHLFHGVYDGAVVPNPAEVEDFVDLPQLRDKHRDLTRDAAIASLPAFAAVWDNPDDEVCDVL